MNTTTITITYTITITISITIYFYKNEFVLCAQKNPTTPMVPWA